MKRTKFSINLIVLALLAVVLCVFLAACKDDSTPEEPPIAPVKVSDGFDFELADGKSKNLTVADYITVNGNTVSASSSDETKATATVEGGVLTVTAAANAEGNTTVTLSCEDISISFGVSVHIEYTVSVDGVLTEVRKGGTFTLPSAPTPQDADFEFDYWLVGEEHKAEGDELTVNADLTVTSVNKRKAAVKIKDVGAISVNIGSAKPITVAEYITTHGNAVSADSDDENIATATVEDGVLTVTPVAEGSAVVTLTCGTVEVTFSVTVSPAPVVTYTVKVDGVQVATVNAGQPYTLPAEPSVDEDFEFMGWNVGGEVKQPGESVVVNAHLDITANLERKAAEEVRPGESIVMTLGDDPISFDLSYYISTHGREATAQSGNDEVATAALSRGVVTVTAVAVGSTSVTLTCGEVVVTCSVTVNAEDVGAPKFTSGSIAYDRYSSPNGSYAFVIQVPDAKTFTYEYALAVADANAAFSGDTLIYTATEAVSKILTVNVTATDTANPANVKYVSFTVSVTVTDSTPTLKNAEVDGTSTVLDIFDAPTINLAENINNVANVASYTVDGASTGIENGVYTVVDNSYTAEPSEVTLNIVATDTNGGTVSYAYKIKVINSSAYRIKNGGFENGITDWGKVLVGEEEFFNITDADRWFDDILYGKEGTWLLSGAEDLVDGNKAGNGKEAGKGTLTSSFFTLKKNAVISFKLGGAKNPVTGLKVIDGSGNVLARFYNNEFDNGTLVQYYYAFDNAEEIADCRICIYDDAVSDWGLVAVDAIQTYYPDSFIIPDGAKVAINSYADRTDLKAAIAAAEALNITELGDYTEESYNAFVAALTEARNVDNEYELPADVNAKTAALNEATANLAVREPVVKENVTTTVSVAPNGSFEINFAAYFDAKNLSKITYTAVTESDKITVGTVADGKTTVTAGADEAADITITLSVLYDNVVKQTVTLTVDISTVVLAPEVKDDAGKTGDYDLYDCTDNKITLNLADNVITNGNATLEYFISVDGGEYGEKIVDPSAFDFVPSGTFTEAAQSVVVTVKVVYEATAGNGEITYVYTLNITDTSSYRIQNGNFDSNLDGWVLSEAALGGISSATQYWENEATIPQFNNDGNFFNAYAEGAAESAKGTLTSSAFTIGGSGWMTYKLGGAKNIEQVYIEAVRESDGKAVKLPNYNWSDYVGAAKRGCSLVAYKVNLIDFCGFALGDVVKIRITDNADADYGLFFLDSVETYYTQEPAAEDYYLVSKYKLYNGGFETGNITGWTVGDGSGDFFNITDADEYFGGPYEKVGTWLLSGVEDKKKDGSGNAGNGKEGGIGTLVSSTFILKQNALISFKFGGGCNNDQIYVEVVKADGTVLAKFFNTAPQDGKLIQYHYQFADMSGDEECFIRVTDNAVSNWGCISLDAIDTDCSVAIGTEATNQI